MTTTPTPLDPLDPGDAVAFARLYDATAPRVFGLVLRVVRDPALAERLTAEVYLAAWCSAAGRDPSTGCAWLLAAAHRHAVVGARTEPDPVGARSVVPAVAAPTELAGQVTSALAGLTTPQRELLELTWFAGWTHAEATVVLGGPAGPRAVRDALLRLRELLGRPA